MYVPVLKENDSVVPGVISPIVGSLISTLNVPVNVATTVVPDVMPAAPDTIVPGCTFVTLSKNSIEVLAVVVAVVTAVAGLGSVVKS